MTGMAWAPPTVLHSSAGEIDVGGAPRKSCQEGGGDGDVSMTESQGSAASRPGSAPTIDCQLLSRQPPGFTSYQNPVPGAGSAESVSTVPPPITPIPSNERSR